MYSVDRCLPACLPALFCVTYSWYAVCQGLHYIRIHCLQNVQVYGPDPWLVVDLGIPFQVVNIIIYGQSGAVTRELFELQLYLSSCILN